MECPICEKEFVQVRKNLTCSPECRKIRKRRYLVEAVTKRRRLIKRKAVEYKGGKCQLCGYCRSVEGMDFHHLGAEHKDFGIGQKGHSRSWARVKAELDKCALVCATCHREIHAGIVSIDKGMNVDF